MSAILDSAHLQEKDVCALHEAALKLIDDPANLSQNLVNIDKRISAMLADAHYTSFSKGLGTVRACLKDIENHLGHNKRASLDLDCLGISVQIRAIFRDTCPSLYKSYQGHEKDEEVIRELIDKADIPGLEKFLIHHRSDINVNQIAFGTFIAKVIQKACELVSLQDALSLVALVIRAGGELNVHHSTHILFPSINAVCRAPELKHKEHILKLLLTHGASPNLSETAAPHKDFGQLPLMLPVLVQKNRLTEAMVQLLIDHGLNVNLKGPNGETPLSEAFGRKCDSLAQRLIYNGANPETNLDELSKAKAQQWAKERHYAEREYFASKAQALSSAMAKKGGKLGQLPKEIFSKISGWNISSKDNVAIVLLCYEKAAKLSRTS